MSYDLYLRDRVTGECLQVPGHLMYGGNVKCRSVDGMLVPDVTTDAYLNVTYNYGRYYSEAFPALKENGGRHGEDAKKYGITDDDGGIRSLNGLSGVQAVPFLEEMVRRIESKYKDFEGWIDTEREKVWYESRRNPNVKKDPTDMFLEYLNLKKDGLSDEQVGKHLEERWTKREKTVLVSEGDTSDYWEATAANAIRPLYQLIALSQMRPDGVWSEES